MKKRAVAYCRVSTHSDDQENSFENQQSYFQREIRNNEDYEFCDIYADKGITGTTLEKRPDFNRMLTDAGLDIENGYKIIAEPKFDIILTKNTSRFARNVSVDVILKALSKNKVYVHFLDLDKTTENADDITYIQIFSTFDERDSRDKSKKTSFGMIEGAKKRVILCNNKIHGYDYIPKGGKDGNRLVANDQAPHIKRMFEMYADGIGAYRIANIFREEGILSKSGKPYSEATIRGILANEKYYGMVTRLKYDTGVVFNKHYPHIRPEGKQIRFRTTRVEPIITEELFNKVQEIRTGRIHHIKQVGKKGIHRGSSKYGYKVFCASCGRQYRATATREYSYGTERYYACVGKGKEYTPDRCTNPNVSETFLNNELSSEKYTMILAHNFIAAQKFLVEVRTDIKNALADKNANEELARLKAEHNEYQEQIEKAMRFAVLGSGATETAEKLVEEISQKDGKVVAKIEVLEKPMNEKLNDLKKIDESIEELGTRLSEIYDVEKDEFGVSYVDYNVPYSVEPKKYFTHDEVLKDMERIMVRSSKVLDIKFKTFTEIEQLVKNHESIMTERTLELFEELRANGWDMMFDTHNSTWLRYDGFDEKI